MPSYPLAALSKQIENQSTDHFGKFYLYATLLKTIAVRKKSFLEGMPKYQRHFMLGTMTSINVGSIDADFSQKVSQYKSQYDDIKPNFIRSVQNIFLAFARKGQLSDLIFILDKMNAHLNTLPMADESHNQSIHRGISFEDRKINVIILLNAAREVTKHAQNSIDNAMYGFGTLIAAMLAIHLTMALGGIFLTLAMLGIGACAVFYFFQTAVTSFQSIKDAADNFENLFQCMIKKQEDETYAPNNLNFIIKGVLFPIAYAGLTAWEQIAPTEDETKAAAEKRTELDVYSDSVLVSSVYHEV